MLRTNVKNGYRLMTWLWLLCLSPWVLANVDFYNVDENMQAAEKAYAQGALTESVFALERVLALEPDHYEAMALKAKVHLALNEKSVAKTLLAKMQQHASYDPEDKRIITLQKAAYQRGTLRGFVGYRYSYDDNLTAVPSGDELFIPALDQNVSLLNSSEEKGSRQTFYAGASYNYKLNERVHWYNNAYVGYSDDKVFRRYRINAKTGLALQQGKFNYRTDLALAWDKTERTQEYIDTVLSGRAIYSLSSQSTVQGRIGLRYLDYAEQDSRDQTFVQLGTGYRLNLNQDWQLRLDLDHWHSVDANRGESILVAGYDQTELALGLAYQVSTEAKLKFRFKYGDRDYKEIDPAFLVVRNDDIWSGQISYDYTFPNNLLLNIGLYSIDNQSNNELVDYDKTSLFIGITQLF